MTANSNSPLKMLKDADWLHNSATQKVFSALNQEGCLSRAVGGSVRNTLLGQPVKDIDIASSATPETSMRLAQNAGLKVIPTGLQHGTITVMSEDIPYEVTTLRKDIETDGRHATVAFTESWVADASRRDFTMNALYVDADGVLYDPLQGYDDLMAKRVRFIGDPVQRIKEDYLRILRFFRFKAEYGLDTLDQQSLTACIREKDGMRNLSAERISSELLRLIQAPFALAIINLMYSSGLLTDLLATAPNIKRLAKLVKLDNTLSRPPCSILRLAALSVYVADDINRIAKRFRLSNENRKQLTAILQHKQNYASMSPEEIRREIYLHGNSYFQNQLMYAWTLSQDLTTDNRWKEHYALAKEWTPPLFPLKGRDLLGIGYENGPALGKRLRCLEQKWIDSNFSITATELLQLAREQLTNH